MLFYIIRHGLIYNFIEFILFYLVVSTYILLYLGPSRTVPGLGLPYCTVSDSSMQCGDFVSED